MYFNYRRRIRAEPYEYAKYAYKEHLVLLAKLDPLVAKRYLAVYWLRLRYSLIMRP